MARPLRIEFPGALYHVTARGNQRGDIFLDDHDRYTWLEIVAQAAERFQWVIYAYCQMINHFHLLVQTLQPNLARCMRHLNGVYTQRFNHHHVQCGHLLQGRYHAILVDEEAYLLEVARYILLNPVRAGLVQHVSDWHWSSYRATCGQQSAPVWLGAAHLLQRFSGNAATAIREFERFVDAGIGAASPWTDLRQEIFLGDPAFVGAMQDCMLDARRHNGEIPQVQRTGSAPCLQDLLASATDVTAAVATAYGSGHFTIRQIADHLGVHYSTISRLLGRRGVIDCKT
jgi:REP element-mobilizing transposase RayT